MKSFYESFVEPRATVLQRYSCFYAPPLLRTTTILLYTNIYIIININKFNNK